MAAVKHLDPRRIVLVGMRATGKTTLGRRLARALRWPFRDGDQAIARATRRTTARWIRVAGEPAFRAVEERITKRLLARPGPWVVALGGGAVQSAAVRRCLRNVPHVIWLRASVPTLVARLTRSRRDRPSLTGRPPAEEVPRLLRRRAPLYRAIATFALNTTCGNAEEWARRALARIRGTT